MTHQSSAESNQPANPGRIATILYWFVTAMCVSLIAVPGNLTFHDLPNHLARYYILARDSDTAFTKDLYNIHFGLTPNMGFDVLADALGHLMPCEYAVKVILIASLLCFAVGNLLLSKSRNDGEASPTILILPILFFSFSCLMGFLNFVLASSVLPLIYYASERVKSPSKMATLVVISMLVIYFAHLMAALILFILFIFVGAKQWKTPLGKSMLISSFVSMAIIGVLYKMGTLTGEASVWNFSPLGYKFWLLRSTFGVGSRQFLLGDVLYGLVLLAIVFRKATLSRIDFILVAILGVLYMICPFGLALTANLDGRLVPIGLGFFVALVRWQKPKHATAQLAWTCSFALVGLFGLYMVAKMVGKGDIESTKIRIYAQQMSAGDMLIPLDINGLDSQVRSNWDPGLRMAPYFAICEKQLIMPGIFMFASQQPVTVKPGNPILDFVNDQKPGDSAQVQMDKGIEKIKQLLKESRSFANTPIYLLIVNHAHTGIPGNKDIQMIDQDENIGLAKLTVPE